MKILFYLGHPAHFHLFRFVIQNLKENNHEVLILIKKKDILEELLKELGWDYTNILPRGRKDNFISIGLGLLNRDLALFKITRSFKPDLMLGTSAEIAHVGRIRNIPSIVVNEDDFDVVPLFSKLAYPFSSYILAPSSCRMGKWLEKTIYYEGFHELTYLHPKYFEPDIHKVKDLIGGNKRFYILRFAKLSAHHDAGKTGITTQIAEKLINMLEPSGNVFITSERELEPQFEKYRIQLNPMDIHHALHFAHIYVGDSQTMAAEAAVLGTPSVRFNDFVGKIGYLDELENKYHLSFGIKTSKPEMLFNKISELLRMNELKSDWQNHRRRMLNDKIDVTSFMVWLIENFPDSINKIKNNPEYQFNFKS